MSDPSPSGETWVCRAAKGYTRCDVLPCTVRGYPEHKRCGPVPSSDTPSDERCTGARDCPAPLHVHGCWADHSGAACDDRSDHGHRSAKTAPPPTPVDGDSGEALRFTAEVQGERTVYVVITDHGNGGESYTAGPFTDDTHVVARPRVAAALAAQINRPPSPVGEERRPVDVTALPEWESFVKRHQHYGGLGLGQHGECADCSLIEAVAAADRGDRA